jgi:hypothetical protein
MLVAMTAVLTATAMIRDIREGMALSDPENGPWTRLQRNRGGAWRRPCFKPEITAGRW